jgi:lipopolysaccharide transport system ATP-binding protein
MIALRVDNLSKSYRIAHQANGAAGRYRTLREDLADIPKRLLARLGSASGANSSHGSSEEFHALRDISFEVRQGDRRC